MAEFFNLPTDAGLVIHVTGYVDLCHLFMNLEWLGLYGPCWVHPWRMLTLNPCMNPLRAQWTGPAPGHQKGLKGGFHPLERGFLHL